MNLFLVSSLLILSSTATASEIPRLSIQRLRSDRGESGTNLHDLLSDHGLLRIAVDKFASRTRREALTHMCQCSAFLDEDVSDSHPHDMEAKVLNDGTDRRTIGTASFGLSRTLDLPPWLEEECGEDAFAAFEGLRDVVSNVVELFVSKLDQENGESPAALTSEKTYREAMSTVNHLEHFHVYDKPSSAVDGLETLKFHTDAGFFLVFVPAMDCHSSQTDNESFFLKGSDVPLTFEDDEVIIMMGAGSQYSLNSGRTSGTLNPESPFVAAPHALRMKAGIRRSWYGKMHLLPAPVEEPILLSFDEPIQLMPQEVHRNLRAIPTDCNNKTAFFCWYHCIDFPEEPEGEADQSMYCADPAKVTQDGDITEAYESCGGGFAHNSKCKGIWTETVDDPAVVPYDFITGSVTIGISIKFDAYPEDISWTLKNTCLGGSKVIAVGGGYTRNLNNKTVTESFATPDGTFEFQIADAFGDGLCCAYGDGFYSVSRQRQELFGSQLENPSVGTTTQFGSLATCKGSPPTAINEIIVTAQVDMTCDVEGCSYPTCTVGNPTHYPTVEGKVTSASGAFGASYGNAGFFIHDGTGGIFVETDGDLGLEVGEHVRFFDGVTKCLYGTLALSGGTGGIDRAAQGSGVVFSPRQVGQLSKPPAIVGNPAVVPNFCNCLSPFSAAGGTVLTVRGLAAADLEDDSVYGYKLFLDDGHGVGQVFIDMASDLASLVPALRETLLVRGADLCVTGLVAQFAGVGWELLPRTGDDIWRAHPEGSCYPRTD